MRYEDHIGWGHDNHKKVFGTPIKEVIQSVKTVTAQKIEFVAVKQGFQINSQNNKDMISNIMVTIFSLLAELERDLISERTKKES